MSRKRRRCELSVTLTFLVKTVFDHKKASITATHHGTCPMLLLHKLHMFQIVFVIAVFKIHRIMYTKSIH